MAVDLLASPSFAKKGGYPDYYTMMLNQVLHGRPHMDEKEWQNAQEDCAREAYDCGDTFVLEDYAKCLSRALRLVPIYRSKTYLLPVVEGYEDGPY